jgi:hypothetical protein
MQSYCLTIHWKNQSPTIVHKDLPNKEDAGKWKTLCLDICGKDDKGEKYTKATLMKTADKPICGLTFAQIQNMQQKRA